MVAKTAQAAGIPETKAKLVYNAIFGLMRDEVKNGESIRIPDFGTFKPVIRSARMGINPKTKEPLRIPEKKSVRLVVSSKFFD